jgi:hypothetical protein
MDLAQVALDIALKVHPVWSGTATNTTGKLLLKDALLPRAGEHFTGGTAWLLGSTLSLHTVRSHSEGGLELDTAPSGTSPYSYVVSGHPFSALLGAINAVLVDKMEMTYEDITIDDDDTPAIYTPTIARDIRRVEIIPDDTDSDPSYHHYWKEDTRGLYFYYSVPSVEGTIRLHYPQRIPTKTAATDTIPDRLPYPAFINHCAQTLLRMSIARMHDSKSVNYELMNDMKDQLERLAGAEHWQANLLLPHDPRYFA